MLSLYAAVIADPFGAHHPPCLYLNYDVQHFSRRWLFFFPVFQEKKVQDLHPDTGEFDEP